MSRRKEYLKEVERTGHDPKGLVKVESTKTTTYCLLLDRTDNGVKWLNWKTDGRQWQDPDVAPRELLDKVPRFARSLNKLVEDAGIENVRKRGGKYRAEITITTPVSQTMIIKRTRAHAKLMLSWLK